VPAGGSGGWLGIGVILVGTGCADFAGAARGRQRWVAGSLVGPPSVSPTPDPHRGRGGRGCAGPS
jgi:hypothetical protein